MKDWTRAAALNNARWCDAVCRAHGKPGRFLPPIWVNAETVPRFYPNAVTLEAGEEALEEQRSSLEEALKELKTTTAARLELADTVRELSTPVLKLYDQVLVLPLIGTINSERAKQIDAAPWRPTLMNLGSGKDYHAGWLNLDILERAQPDLVLNLAEPLALPLRATTATQGELLLEEGSVELINANNVLEHVPDPSSIVRACSALVKPGGWVFFSTINRNPKAWLMAVVGAEHVLKLLPKGTHQYRDFIKPSELAGALRAADLALEDVSGLVYDPLRHRAERRRAPFENYELDGP